MKITEEGVFTDIGTRAMPMPFKVLGRFGRWKPICVRHKLLFKSMAAYASHWTPLCNDVQPDEYPPSDLKKHLTGYTKV